MKRRAKTEALAKKVPDIITRGELNNSYFHCPIYDQGTCFEICLSRATLRFEKEHKVKKVVRRKCLKCSILRRALIDIVTNYKSKSVPNKRKAKVVI